MRLTRKIMEQYAFIALRIARAARRRGWTIDYPFQGAMIITTDNGEEYEWDWTRVTEQAWTDPEIEEYLDELAEPMDD